MIWRLSRRLFLAGAAAAVATPALALMPNNKRLMLAQSVSPVAPAGFLFLVDSDGYYLIDSDGYYLVEPI